MIKYRHVNFEGKAVLLARLWGAALFAAVLAGCNNSGVATAPNAPRPVTSAPTGTPAVTGSTKLTSGPAPLNYFLGPGGPVRFVDLTTGKTIVSATAPLQAVITIDEAKGITVANTLVKAGPLPVGHRYELWLDQRK
jgi:hypothetical protein